MLTACPEYLEQISRYLDGDLSSDEAEALFEHLAHCPGCAEALSSFEELSMMTAESMKQPPERLHDGVLTSIRAAKKRPWYVRYRFTAVAAVFALVVFALSGTPLAKYFTRSAEQEPLAVSEPTKQQQPTTAFSAPSSADSTPQAKTTPPVATNESRMVPKEGAESDAEPPASNLPLADEEAPPTDSSDFASGGGSSAQAQTEEIAEEELSDTYEVDTTLLPQTPYERTFFKYLMFSAKDAPEVLYSITSDRTVDHVIYYIVTPEQFTDVQSALLEDGIEVSVVPGDPESGEALLILTIED